MDNEGTTVNVCHTYYESITALNARGIEMSEAWLWGRTQFRWRDFGYIPVLWIYRESIYLFFTFYINNLFCICSACNFLCLCISYPIAWNAFCPNFPLDAILPTHSAKTSPRSHVHETFHRTFLPGIGRTCIIGIPTALTFYVLFPLFCYKSLEIGSNYILFISSFEHLT